MLSSQISLSPDAVPSNRPVSEPSPDPAVPHELSATGSSASADSPSSRVVVNQSQSSAAAPCPDVAITRESGGSLGITDLGSNTATRSNSATYASHASDTAVGLYLEEIARLRRDLQGANHLAEHRLRVIFELQEAVAATAEKEPPVQDSRPNKENTKLRELEDAIPAAPAAKMKCDWLVEVAHGEEQRSSIQRPKQPVQSGDASLRARALVFAEPTPCAARSATCDSRSRVGCGSFGPATRPQALFSTVVTAPTNARKGSSTILGLATSTAVPPAQTPTSATAAVLAATKRSGSSMSPRAFLAPRNPNHPNQPLIGKQLPEQSPVGLTQSPTHCESHHIDPLAAMSSPVDGGEKQQHQETSDCRARDSRSPSPAVLASSPVVEVAEAPLARAAPVVPKLAAAATCDNCEAATVLLRGRCRDVRSRPHTDGKGDARPPLNLLRLQTSSRPGDEAVLRAGAPRHQTAQQTHTAATKLRGGTHFTRVQSNLTPKAEAASGGERSTTAAAVAEAQPRRTSSSASNTKSAALPSRRLMRTLSTKTNASNLTRTSSAFSGFPAPTANPKTPAHRARSRSRRGCGDASRPAEADKERPTALKKNCHRSSHRFSTLHERYENAQVSLALLRGLVLRADTSLLSLLAKYQASTVTRSDFSAIGKAETSLPFALATVRRLIVRVNPAGFSGKVEEGCLWTLGPHDLSQLEEAAIPGVVSALREVVVAHDWCRATCWYLYCSNEGKESAVPFSRTGSGYLMRRASSARDADTTSNRASGLGVSALEAACMELYANMHVLLTLAQSANAVKRVR